MMGEVNIDVLSNTPTRDYAMEDFRRRMPHGLLVTSVSGMVQSISNRLTGRDRLKRLRIFGHGSPGHQVVGHVSLTYDRGDTTYNYDRDSGKILAAVERRLSSGSTQHLLLNGDALERLAPLFVRGGWVELHGCNVAALTVGQNLLRKLARVLQVSVKASENLQYCGGGLEGTTVVARPSGRTETRSPVPQPPRNSSGCNVAYF